MVCVLTRCISIIMTTTISKSAKPTRIKRLLGVARLWSPSLLWFVLKCLFSLVFWLLFWKCGCLLEKKPKQAPILIIYPVNPVKLEEPNFLLPIGLILYNREKGISFVFLFDLCPGRTFREQVSPWTAVHCCGPKLNYNREMWSFDLNQGEN